MHLPVPAKARLAQRVLRRRFFSKPRRFEGNAEDICRQIVETCWNGTFLQTSIGHLKDFWVRDLAICTPALLHLGLRDRVRQSWAWALERFAANGKLTTTVHRWGRTMNFPSESHDALPWLLRALRDLGDQELLRTYRPFLEREVAWYAKRNVDTATGAIRRALVGIRDAVRYHASAYNLTMVGVLSQDLTALSFRNPFRAFNYREILIDRYWTGTHFRADVYGDHFASEANLFPFWTGLIDDRGMWEKIRAYIHALHLTEPYPIKYAPIARTLPAHWYFGIFAPNYQGTTIWSWLGAVYLQLCQKYRSPGQEEEQRAFTAMIERYGTFPELLSPDGSWYKTLAVRADDGMIWASMYLDLLNAKK